MEKFEPKIKEKKSIIDIEVSPEDLERCKDLKDEIKFALENFTLTEEDIKNGFEPVDEGDPFPIHPATFGVECEDPKEEEIITKVMLNFAFEELGFDPRDPELVREKEGVKYFKINSPDVLLCYDGHSCWLEHNKEK